MTKSETRRHIWAVTGQAADSCRATADQIKEIIDLPEYIPDKRLLEGAIKQLEAAWDRLQTVKRRNQPPLR